MTRFLPAAKTLGIALLSTAAFTAPALADTYVSQPVTLTYNVTELQSDAAAFTVLNDLERQAREACVSVEPILNTETVDASCVSDVLDQAVKGIDNDALTAAFLGTDSTQKAALDTETKAQS